MKTKFLIACVAGAGGVALAQVQAPMAGAKPETADKWRPAAHEGIKGAATVDSWKLRPNELKIDTVKGRPAVGGTNAGTTAPGLLRKPGVAATGNEGASAAQAQLLPPPKPGDEQPRADITRKAPGGAVSRSGPGTQTEDDIYVGRKGPGNVTPGPAARPLAPQGPMAAPAIPQLVRPAMPMAAPGSAGATKPLSGTRSRATGDEDEMDDLDIQRRKAQGLPDNKPTSPQKEKPGSEQPRGERRQ